jgi:hemerythrin-like metal-binding protein
MSLINWEESYSVGVKELDDQHKKMFELINELYEAIKASKDKTFMSEILGELLDYGKYHLDTEEKYFNETEYPGKESHKIIHKAYRDKIDEFYENKEDTLLSYKIIDFLEDWWLDHVTSIDKGYKEYVIGKMI